MIDFSNPPFTFKIFNINYFEIAEQVLSHFNNQMNKETNKIEVFKNDDEDIKYIYDGEKIKIISYNIIIEKEPILFFDENNNSFKVYNSQYLKLCLTILDKNYEFYNEDKKINFENIIFGKNKIIKKKIIIDEYFLKLYDRLDKNFIDEKKYLIEVDFLHPLFGKIFHHQSKEINIYLNKERNSFLKMIDDFIYKEKHSPIFYIMGIDGIGKSFSLLFYSCLKNTKPILFTNNEKLSPIIFSTF